MTAVLTLAVGRALLPAVLTGLALLLGCRPRLRAVLALLRSGTLLPAVRRAVLTRLGCGALSVRLAA